MYCPPKESGMPIPNSVTSRSQPLVVAALDTQTTLFQMRTSQCTDDATGLPPGIVPTVHGATLDNDITSTKFGLGAVIELENAAS